MASKGRFVLEFHGVAKRRYPEIPLQAQPGLTAGELRDILAWLQQRFSFLTLEEFLKSEQSGVLLTFDDGFANNYMNALPVLNNFDVPAIFFVSTQHLINPKDWLPATKSLTKKYWDKDDDVPNVIAQEFFDGLSIKQLQSCIENPLITIGAHTVSHPFLTKCTQDQLEHELTASKQHLEDLMGRSVDVFAYPAGDYNHKVIESVRCAGYIAAFVEDSLNVGLPLFEIPRIGIYSADPAYLALKLSGLHRLPIKGKLL